MYGDESSRGAGAAFSLIMAGVAVLVAVFAVIVVVSRGEERRGGAPSGVTSVQTSAAAPVPTPVPAPVPVGPAAPPPIRPPVPPPVEPNTFAYQPLWPFRGLGDAAEWQRAYRSGGHQPWHLDAAATAQSFTRHYLGYANVDQVIGADIRGDQAWVRVGYENPNGVPSTAAVIHLARLGIGADAPWEVVGTEDTTLTLAIPGYGTRILSPVTVGGRISGVDESLDIQLRQLDRPDVVGRLSGLPAGGIGTPWTATVPFAANCPGVLTIAVATGGHVVDVERFAITGVRC